MNMRVIRMMHIIIEHKCTDYARYLTEEGSRIAIGGDGIAEIRCRSVINVVYS
jgi:hypothetical protein